MLQEVKTYIQNIPDRPFGEMYQEYVRSTQDRILSHSISTASDNFTELEDATLVIKGLNNITEELNKI